jgi:hypothetical protein
MRVRVPYCPECLETGRKECCGVSDPSAPLNCSVCDDTNDDTVGGFDFCNGCVDMHLRSFSGAKASM